MAKRKTAPPSGTRGYKRIPGASRRYSRDGGKTSISRREYDNRRARQAGFRNRYEVERLRKRLLQDDGAINWIFKVRAVQGRAPTFDEYHAFAEVKRLRAIDKAKYPGLNRPDRDAKNKKLTAVGGPLELMLAAAGLRQPNGRPVGDS